MLIYCPDHSISTVVVSFMLSSVFSAISYVAWAVSHGITYTLILATESAGSGLLSLLFMAVDGLRSLSQFLLDSVLDVVVYAATAAGTLSTIYHCTYL